MKELKKNVSLLCNTCGNDQFSVLDTDIQNLRDASSESRIQCSDCGKIMTKAELIEENQEVIDAHVQEIKKEVLQEFKKMFKSR